MIITGIPTKEKAETAPMKISSMIQKGSCFCRSDGCNPAPHAGHRCSRITRRSLEFTMLLRREYTFVGLWKRFNVRIRR